VPYVVADYIIERLAQRGVQTLFGVPAAYCSALYDAAERAPDFGIVVTNSDLEAGYAADGYARVRGLSAVAVSYGPGTLSLVNAIAAAYAERSPIVVVNGGPSQANIDTQHNTGVLFSHSMGRPHTDLDVFSNITAFCERATQVGDVPQLVDTALTTALSRQHPVYIEIPQGMLSVTCPRPVGALDVTVPAGGAGAAATLILQQIQAASNPLVIVGVEVARYRLASKVMSFLDRLQIRWATTLLAKSTLPEQHSGFVGVFNGDKAPASLKNMIQSSGLIVALGAVFGSGHANLMIPKFDKTIRVWDGTMVARAAAPQVVGLPALVDALDQQSVGMTPVSYPGGVPPPPGPAPATPDAPELGYQQAFDVVTEPAFLDATFTVVADTFLGIYPAARIPMPSQDSFIADAVWASTGHAAGAAVGAFVPGGKRPLVLIGDGGFQMVGQALSTMVRYQHNTVVVIVDNNLYGFEQFLLGPTYYTNPGQAPLPYVVLPDWDFDAFARALGVTQVATVTTPQALRTALAAAKTHTAGPSVIRALVGSRSLPAGI
jgi:indolepyruvate decarboxylase